MKLPKGLLKLVIGKPKPSFETVIPTGAGWYQFNWNTMMYQRVDEKETYITDDMVYLSPYDLADFAYDAIMHLIQP